MFHITLYNRPTQVPAAPVKTALYRTPYGNLMNDIQQNPAIAVDMQIESRALLMGRQYVDQNVSTIDLVTAHKILINSHHLDI
jgi:hypothetical protein